MSKFSLGFLLLLLSISFVSLVHGSVVIDKSVEVKSVIDGVSFRTTSEDIFKLADVESRTQIGITLQVLYLQRVFWHQL